MPFILRYVKQNMSREKRLRCVPEQKKENKHISTIIDHFEFSGGDSSNHSRRRCGCVSLAQNNEWGLEFVSDFSEHLRPTTHRVGIGKFRTLVTEVSAIIHKFKGVLMPGVTALFWWGGASSDGMYRRVGFHCYCVWSALQSGQKRQLGIDEEAEKIQ